MKKRNLGFTFVELLVVITIIAVITSVAAASYGTTNKNARDARRRADLEQIRAALELCRAEAGQYPATVTFGGQLTCDDGEVYLNPVPTDPKLGQSGFTYTYNRTALTAYQLCATTMEGVGETSPYCVYDP